MTEMYDKPRKFEKQLKPYPHEERGVEVRRSTSHASNQSDLRVIFSFSRTLTIFYYCFLFRSFRSEAAPRTP